MLLSEERNHTMAAVTIQLDTAELAKLLERVEAGEEVMLACDSKVVLRLLPEGKVKPQRKPGRLKGKISLDESFFDPLPEEELKPWGQ
jgi:antitoxin (DNA-binding transcriptional repressor) of toxin-antitoxin stability system